MSKLETRGDWPVTTYVIEEIQKPTAVFFSILVPCFSFLSSSTAFS